MPPPLAGGGTAGDPERVTGYLLQLQSPLPVLQWPQRQELDLQKQEPLGAAAFSAGVGSALGGAVSHPVAIRTAASNVRSFVIAPSVELSVPPQLYPMILARN